MIINDIIYAELSTRFATVEEVDGAVAGLGLHMMPLPRSALLLAGKAYVRYRSQGGTKTGVLPDFFVGAHATVVGWPLLTRDAGRVKTYFPDIALITP
jgi:predicted nucleic acid-binding protein